MTKYYRFHHEATESKLTPAFQQQEARSGKPLVIWRLTDGKPGHENQSLGLCNALDRVVGVARYDIPVVGRFSSWLHWLTGRFPAGSRLPAPSLVIGAGHRTHPALLAARRAFGGRTVVLMKPSLPLSLFDLCIIPEHDGVTGENVFVTRGVMNTISSPSECGSAAKLPAGAAATEREDSSQTLILLGGSSPHYQWRDEAVLEQVNTIVSRQPEERFVLSDSRRTAAGFLEKTAALKLTNLTLVPWQQSGPGWVAEQLGMSCAVWVSEDSVSMVYEALTSGAAVGLITLKQTKPGRVSDGIQRLVGAEWVTPFDAWRKRGALAVPPGTFNEALRCAEWVADQWLTRD